MTYFTYKKYGNKGEKDQKKRKAYTDEEKFKKMLESNPTLFRLKNELSLDFI